MVRLCSCVFLAIPLLAGTARFAASQSPQSESPPVVRAYPVLDLLEPYGVPTPPPVGRLLVSQNLGPWLSMDRWTFIDRDVDDGPPTLFARSDQGPFRDADQILEYLRDRIGKETWGREVAWMEINNGILYVSGSPAVLDRLESLVRALRPSFAPRSQFDYVLFRSCEEKDPSTTSVIPLAEADDLIQRLSKGQGGSILYHARAQKRAGDGFQFGAGTTHGFLSDVDAEIAQAASIVEPVVCRLPLGHDLTAQSMVTTDEYGLALFGLFTGRTLVGSPEPLDLIVNGIRLERVRVRTIQSGFSIRLPDHGAVLYRPGGWSEPDLTVLFVVRRLDDVSPGEPSRRVVPIGCLTSPVFTGSPGCVGGLDTTPVDREFLLDKALSIGCGDKHEEALDISGQTHLAVITGDPEAVHRSVEFIRTVANHTERGYLVEIIRETRARDATGSNWQPAGHIVVPCIARRLGFVTLGDEETIVVDHDVEVAQKAKLYDPVVQSVFDGIQAVVSIEPVGDVCRVRLALLYQKRDDARPVAPPSPDVGPIAIPRIHHVIFRRTMFMTPGSTHLLGDIPATDLAGDVSHRARIRLRVSER
jgi:hypothetical protein